MSGKRDDALAAATAQGTKKQGKRDAPSLPQASATRKRTGADLHFARLLAAFARERFTLRQLKRRGQTIFTVSRWNQAREFDTLGEVESFLAHVTRGRS